MDSIKIKSSEEQIDQKEMNSLKGTLIGVGVLGFIIVVMWIGVFHALYG